MHIPYPFDTRPDELHDNIVDEFNRQLPGTPKAVRDYVVPDHDAAQIAEDLLSDHDGEYHRITESSIESAVSGMLAAYEQEKSPASDLW